MSKSQEVSIYDHYDQMKKVAGMSMKGIPVHKIVSQTGIPRKYVLELLDEWKRTMRDGVHLQTLATDLVLETQESYKAIKEELWQAAEDAGLSGDLRTKTTALKAIADVEAKMVDMMQKAGVLSDKETGDQLASALEMLQLMKQLMEEVAEKYPESHSMILEGLTRIFQKPVAMQI